MITLMHGGMLSIGIMLQTDFLRLPDKCLIWTNSFKVKLGFPSYEQESKLYCNFCNFARFQNVDRQHSFYEIFKMSTESLFFARFSKCRPKAHVCEIFKLSIEIRCSVDWFLCWNFWFIPFPVFPVVIVLQ